MRQAGTLLSESEFRQMRWQCACSGVFAGPVAAPSANRSGKVSPTKASHVIADLSGRINAVIDGGPCAHGIESTIVSTQGGQARVLRHGAIPEEMIINRNVPQPKSSSASFRTRNPRPTGKPLCSEVATEAQRGKTGFKRALACFRPRMRRRGIQSV